MVATVIVAVPPVGDPIYKISSEKIPHLTLLFLGEASLSEEAILYVQHATQQMSPFGFSVDYRGTLGEDEADVLFFEKNAWDMKRVSEFRHHLLLNDEIKRAYDTAPQFPEWTPHLTLGYPETPANDPKLGEDHSLHYVNFDRIMVWVDDFDGPEFRLRYEDDYGQEVAAMSDISTVDRGEAAANGLFHYGVKGMRWGVRKAEDSSGSAPSGRQAKKAAKEAHKEWKKESASSEKANAIFQQAAKDFESTLKVINNDANYKGKDLSAPENRRLARDYDATVATLFNRQLAQTSVDMTITESGRAWIYSFDRNTGLLRGSEYQAKLDHSDEKDFPDFRVELDAIGHVVGITMVGSLKHYGVKGMRWGVTRNADGTTTVDQTRVRKSLRSTDKAVTVTQRKAGTYVKTKGGQRQTATTDAIKTQAARQKAKRSTTDSLTTKELKDTIERMRLEQEFAKLNKKVSRKGESFVSRLLSSPEGRKAAEDLLVGAAKSAV